MLDRVLRMLRRKYQTVSSDRSRDALDYLNQIVNQCLAISGVNVAARMSQIVALQVIADCQLRVAELRGQPVPE